MGSPEPPKLRHQPLTFFAEPLKKRAAGPSVGIERSSCFVQWTRLTSHTQQMWRQFQHHDTWHLSLTQSRREGPVVAPLAPQIPTLETGPIAPVAGEFVGHYLGAVIRHRSGRTREQNIDSNADAPRAGFTPVTQDARPFHLSVVRDVLLPGEPCQKVQPSSHQQEEEDDRHSAPNPLRSARTGSR